MAAIDPLVCERCQRPLESDDAISVIEGVCGLCRNTAQSLVQPVRADEILSKTRGHGSSFLDDLPSLNAPIEDKTPWLVDDAEADRDERVAAGPFINTYDDSAVTISEDDDEAAYVPSDDDDGYGPYVVDDVDDDRRTDDDYESGAQFDEPFRVHLDEADDVEDKSEPLIPPGPFSAAKRRAAARNPDLDAISEIFSPESVPPSELPAQDGDDDDGESISRVDIHRFNPPPPKKAPSNSSKPSRRRHRNRAIRTGVLLGTTLTFGLAIYGFVFSDWQDKIERLIARGTPNSTTEITTPAIASDMQLLVDPAGADILVDGHKLGSADRQGRFSLTPEDLTNAREIEVRAAGFHTAQLTVDDITGSPESVIRLLRKPFKVAVESSPPGADILVDGQLIGQTPATVTIATEQSNAITLRKQGYESVDRNIPMPAAGDDPVRLDVALNRTGVMLTVSTLPVPAEVWVDGRLLGMTPIEEKLPALYRGREVEVVARAVGFDDTRAQIEIPLQGEEISATELKLTRTMARVNVRTEPPGGRVVVAGRDYGFAPTMIEFEPSQTGRSVVLDASSRGEYFGRRNIVVPPPGVPREFVVDMQRSAQRVVFVVAADRAAGAEQFVLIDELSRLIEDLDASHRFAVVAATDEGVETWPYEVAFENASDEQKIRAFDMIRSIRTADEIPDDKLLNSVAQLAPSVVWLFTTVELERDALESFSSIFPDDKQVTINVVKSRSSNTDTWLGGFVARHGGAFKTLDTMAVSESYE